jgi:hypothetical protein
MPASARTVLSITPLACAAAILIGVKEPPRAGAEQPAPPVSLGEAFECTAISEVIRANDGRVPRSGTELVQALAKVGDFAQLPVPFSAVALDSGLLRPRVILAPRPGRGVPGAPRPNGLPAFGDLPLAPPPSPLSAAKATQAHIEGRLFLAANMEGNTPAELRVKTIEFISWNTRKKAFDFGVIDCAGEKAEIQILDGVRCFACHKNHGPILGQGPWSNTTHNDVVRAAALKALVSEKALPVDNPRDGPVRPDVVPVPGFQPGVFGFPRIEGVLRDRTTFDGLSLVAGEPEVCDLSIRLGGNLARDREIFKVMTKTGDGRRALLLLMTGIAGGQPIQKADLDLRTAVNRAYAASFPVFAKQFVALHRSMSNTLGDYSPSGSMGSLRTIVTNQPATWGGGSFQSTDIVIVWGGTPDKVTAYDKSRSEGEHGMPSARLPSNPRSFFRPTVNVPLQPSSAVSATQLAQTLGITEGDREFMANALANLASSIRKPNVSTSTLVKEVFTAPPFVEALKAGNLPDREEFKDLFADALAHVAKEHKVDPPKIARGDYASGPSGAVAPGQEYKQPAIVPTTACLRCHDVKGAGKPSAFNPIPTLAFDPFDTTGRDAWVKATKPRDRVAILTRLNKRLVTD